MSVWQNSPAVMSKREYSDGTYPCAGSNAICTHRISSLSMIRARKFSISGSPELPRSAMRAPLSLYHMPPRSLSHSSVSFESVISNGRYLSARYFSSPLSSTEHLYLASGFLIRQPVLIHIRFSAAQRFRNAVSSSIFPGNGARERYIFPVMI